MELNEQNCTVCTKIIDSDPVTVNKAILDLFEFLADTIDRSALQNALICEICLETVNEAVNFKMAHLERQKISSQETRQNPNEKFVICYICKNTTQPHSAMSLLNSCYENEISYMIPKKDLDNFVNPQICDRCHTFALNFRNITLFLSVHDVTKTTNDQLKSDTIIEEEEFKIDVVDNCLPEDSELNAGMSQKLKQEIKEEIEDSGDNFHKKQAEMVWMEYEAAPSSAWSFNVKVKKRSSTVLYPGNLIACTNDSNLTTSVIKTEMDYKELSILNNEKFYQNLNMLVHKDANEVDLFKCQNCQFQTKHKSSLKRHMLIHKDINEVELFRCQNCQYQTKQKGCLRQHMLIHKDTNKIELFKCHNCQYQTKLKSYLKKHMLIHKDMNKIELFKCQNCQYQSKEKGKLKRHILIHKNPNEVELFKCQNCQYQTKQKGCLRRHMLIHKDPNEIELFKCHNCQFQTKRKSYLNSHMLIHKETNKIKLFKCHNCQYQTKLKSYLKNHRLIHKDPNKIELFKCQNCQYHSKDKSNLKRHMLIHKNPNEVEMFKCHNCQYQSKDKGKLKRHMLIHKNPNEVELFKCLNCQYQTKQKSTLRRHMRIHKDRSK